MHGLAAMCLLCLLSALARPPDLRGGGGRVRTPLAAPLRSSLSLGSDLIERPPRANATGVVPASWTLSARYERRSDLLHLEYRDGKGVRGLLDRLLPSPMRTKPLAKVGVRGSARSSALMSERIRAEFGSTSSGEEEGEGMEERVCAFVYMWVCPTCRGGGLGDELLALASEHSLARGVRHMLLVHDDDGSGRLVRYYQRRGFVPVFDLVDRGMLKRLAPLSSPV